MSVTESVGTGSAAQVQFVEESDFSFRKMKLATVILVAQIFATSLLPFMALTLVMVPMTTEFGWTATQFSFATSALMWFGGATNPFYGRFFDTVGVRLPIMLGTLGVAAVTFALAFQTPNVWMFYICFALLGMFGSSAIGYAKVTSALFTKHRGKAFALIGVESTLAAAAVPPLLNWLITDYGWRGMFLACSAIIVAIAPIIYFMVDEPGTIGGSRRLLRKRGEKPAPAADPANLPGLTTPEVLRNRAFWLIVAATIIGGAPRSGMQPHLVPMLLEKGFTQQDAVSFLSGMTLIGPIGTLIAGWAVDRIHDARIALPFQLISLVSIIALAFVSASFGGWPLLSVAILTGGFAFGSARPMTQVFHIRFFGLKSFGFYFGFEMMLVAFAMGAAAPLVGLAKDLTGSYELAYWGMMISTAVGGALYFFMGKYRYPANIGAVPVAEMAEELPEANPVAAVTPRPQPA